MTPGYYMWFSYHKNRCMSLIFILSRHEGTQSLSREYLNMIKRKNVHSQLLYILFPKTEYGKMHIQLWCSNSLLSQFPILKHI